MLKNKTLSILNIDLGNRRFHIEYRDDLFEQCVGGTGLCTRLLGDRVLADAPPYHPAQPIVFAIGPLTFVYPMVTKVVAMFKSPQTMELGESHAGLRLGMTMRLAGYDAVVITGRSEKPVYLNITATEVEFRNAQPLWGMDSDSTGLYIRNAVSGSGKRSILRIGPAGENKVCYACATVDDFRHFGRLGLGAVMGSKNLKAIVVSAENSYEIENVKEYKTHYDELYDRITKTPLLMKYHDLGTPENLKPLDMIGALPTRNLQQSSFEAIDQVSGEAFAETVLSKKVSCSGCPVGCIHIASLKRRFSDAHEYQTLSIGYDYELIYALGTLLGIGDIKGVLEMIYRVELLGLDAMQTGVVLGWLTEGFQRGIFSEELLLAKPSFGDVDAYLKIMDAIVRQPNDFYRLLAENMEETARQYGGEDFLLNVNGNGIAGYHTGYGSVFGQAVGGRHSHLDNAGYSADQRKELLTPRQIVDAIIEEEENRCILGSLVICMFARKLYDFDNIARAARILGWETTAEELVETGKRIYRERLELKKKLGYDFSRLEIPKRFFETASYRGVLNRETMEDMLRIYLEKIKPAPEMKEKQ